MPKVEETTEIWSDKGEIVSSSFVVNPIKAPFTGFPILPLDRLLSISKISAFSIPILGKIVGGYNKPVYVLKWRR